LDWFDLISRLNKKTILLLIDFEYYFNGKYPHSFLRGYGFEIGVRQHNTKHVQQAKACVITHKTTHGAKRQSQIELVKGLFRSHVNDAR
jgi:hypothetical protein